MEMLIDTVEAKLGVFGYGKLQDLLTLWGLLDREGITREDVTEYVAAKLDAIARAEKWNTLMAERKAEADKVAATFCPECGNKMNLYPVEGDNPQGYKSRFICEKSRCKGCSKDDADYAQDCLYEILSTRSVQEIQEEMKDKLIKHFGVGGN